MSVSVPDTMESICKYHQTQQHKITHLFRYPTALIPPTPAATMNTREQLINRIIFCELLHVLMNVSIYIILLFIFSPFNIAARSSLSCLVFVFHSESPGWLSFYYDIFHCCARCSPSVSCCCCWAPQSSSYSLLLLVAHKSTKCGYGVCCVYVYAPQPSPTTVQIYDNSPFSPPLLDTLAGGKLSNT